MSDDIRGRRDSRSDTWSWTPTGRERPPRRRPPWLPVLAIVTGLGLFGTGLGWLLLSGGNSENGDDLASATSTTMRTATATAANERSPEATPSATAAPDSGITVNLLAWSRQQSRWFSADLTADAASYREGEAVPLLLRLDQAVAGSTHEITLRYECGTDKGASFDYLSEPSEADAGATLTTPGPARARADSTIPVPDDPSITFDDGGERFQLWGATFEGSPQGPLPSAPCVDVKEIKLNLVAQGQAVFLIWAGHLASAGDWGAGRGSSSQDSAIFMDASIGGVAQARVNVAPDVVVP